MANFNTGPATTITPNTQAVFGVTGPSVSVGAPYATLAALTAAFPPAATPVGLSASYGLAAPYTIVQNNGTAWTSPTSGVASVAGRTGDVVLTSGDINGGALTQTDFATNTSTATGAQFARDMVLTYSPVTAPSQTIPFARRDQIVYATNQSNSGAGHASATISWFQRTGTGDPNLAICHEVKFENNQATGAITAAKGLEAQLAANLGPMTIWYGVNAQLIANSAAISFVRNFNSDIPAALGGSIGEFVGFYQPSINKTGVTTAWSFKNDDAGMPIFSLAPVIESATQRASPLTGTTVTIGANISRLILTPAGTLAALTIALPAVSTLTLRDGLEVDINCSQGITALTVTSSGAAFVIAPASMGPSKAVVLRYDATNTAWWCKSQ